MGTSTGEAPFSQGMRHHVPAVATVGNDSEIALGTVLATGVISDVTYYPDAAITGANTNTRSVTLYDRKADGSGTVALATLQFNSGVNGVAWVGKVIPLNGTAANLNVLAGETLTWASTHVGTGIADPGGLVVVNIARD